MPASPSTSGLSVQDRLDIAETVGAIMMHVDMREWDQAKAYLAPQVTTDYSSIFGGEATTVSRDDLVKGWSSRLAGFDATQHTLTQFIIRGEGDEAESRNNSRAAHWIDGRIWAFGGQTTRRLIRTPDGWRVNRIASRMLYEEGDRAVRAEAIERMSKKLGQSFEALTLIGRSATQRNT